MINVEFDFSHENIQRLLEWEHDNPTCDPYGGMRSILWKYANHEHANYEHTPVEIAPDEWAYVMVRGHYSSIFLVGSLQRTGNIFNVIMLKKNPVIYSGDSEPVPGAEYVKGLYDIYFKLISKSGLDFLLDFIKDNNLPSIATVDFSYRFPSLVANILVRDGFEEFFTLCTMHIT